MISNCKFMIYGLSQACEPKIAQSYKVFAICANFFAFFRKIALRTQRKRHFCRLLRSFIVFLSFVHYPFSQKYFHSGAACRAWMISPSRSISRT